MTQFENETAQTEGNVRAAFYAAEAGLRAGEILLQGRDLAVLLTPTIPVTVPTAMQLVTLPGGGYKAVPLVTSGAAAYLVPVPSRGGPETVYSLYIRNNDEDPAGQSADSDNVVNLVSFGYVRKGNGQLIATKILEEQLKVVQVGAEFGGQKGGNPGGTGSGVRR